MMKSLFNGVLGCLFAVLLAACPKSATVQVQEVTNNVPENAATCANGDRSACLQEARNECGESVWYLAYENPNSDYFPPIYVASNGLIRIDYYGMALLGTNAHDWITCLEECPGSWIKNVCLPIIFDLGFQEFSQAECEVQERDVDTWNKFNAKSLLIDCAKSNTEITFIPDLVHVQKALIASGAIKADSDFAKINGLVVSMSHDGEQILALEKVSDVHCAVFNVPDDFRVKAIAKDFAALNILHPQFEN